MLRKSLAGFLALVVLGLSALFTFGQKINENLPDWDDVYEFFGMAEEIEKAGGVDFDKPVLLGYTGLTDILLQKYIADSSSLWAQSRTDLEYAQIGSVIGTHAGPGAVAAAFFAKN